MGVSIHPMFLFIPPLFLTIFKNSLVSIHPMFLFIIALWNTELELRVPSLYHLPIALSQGLVSEFPSILRNKTRCVILSVHVCSMVRRRRITKGPL